MQAVKRGGIVSVKRQAGMTLMEAMISLALSVVVTTAMVILMSNSLGSATRIIHMSQLTDELRNAMSMMTRDVRRANYSANSIFCYGYSRCGMEGGPALQVGDIQIEADQCFTFTLDRGFNGDATDDSTGGFRRAVDNGVGVMEMWVGDADDTPDCGVDAGSYPWVQVTDPNIVNVTFFEVNDAGSVVREIAETKTTTFDSRQRELLITVRGELMIEQARGN
jgi:type II secretory pathway pseudopilin PulG